MNVLITLLVVLSEVLIMFHFVTRLYNNFNDSKLPILTKINILVVLIITSSTFELLMVLKHSNLSLIYAISLLIIHKFVLKEDLKCTTAGTLITCMLLSLSNNLASSIYLVFSNILNYTLLSMMLPTIFLAVTSIPVLMYVKHNSSKLNLIIDNAGSNMVSTLTFYMILFSLPIILSPDISMFSHKFYFIFLMLTILLSICKFANHYINSKYNKIKSEIYLKDLSSTIDRLRIIKHDYDNILQIMYGYIATKQYDALDSYLKHVVLESKSICYDSKLEPDLVNQPAIYGILSCKYCKAIDKDIDFNINIDTSINDISFNFAELSRILGILLDNAIEASEKTKAKILNISFEEDKVKNAKLIKISNSIKDENIDVDKIFEKGVSSKKIKSGLGLWEVKRLVDSKKNSEIYTSVDNNMFSQELIIQNT